MTDGVSQTLALSLGVSALVTVACRRVRIPALLPLMLAGLGLGASGLGVIDAGSLGGILKGFITVAIGLLIFEGALHLNKEELARAPKAVWGLLTIGALATWAGAACAAKYLLGMSWPISVLLGATLIVTGPTVVQPILRMFHVSPRVHTVLSAEAVLIDPIGVVATITALEVLRLWLSSGPEMTVARAGLWLFAKPLLGGAGVGVVMGLFGLGMLRLYSRAGKIEPPHLNLLAVGACMTSVGIGEAVIPEAGLAAVTICGIIMARARVLGATELRSFKELLAALLVGMLFVLLSSRFDVAQLGGLGWREGVFVLVLLLVVRPVAVSVSTIASKLTTRERLFIGTFAPRGIVALSVAAVAAAELSSLTPSPSSMGPHTADHYDLMADVHRLEPTMFVAIAGTVLMGSIVSPLLAWAIRLRAGEGSSVIIVGGHQLGVALSRELRACGIESRIIDSNEQRAASAASLGLDAIAGDATDSRWMDDVGAPHGAGWLIAWTGNHDVDQLAARWAIERFGEGRAALWSSKPARGNLEACDISRGEAITSLLDRFGDGLVRLTQSKDPERFGVVLGRACDGRFELSAPAADRPTDAKEPVYIGMGYTSPGERVDPVAADVIRTDDHTTASKGPTSP